MKEKDLHYNGYLSLSLRTLPKRAFITANFVVFPENESETNFASLIAHINLLSVIKCDNKGI